MINERSRWRRSLRHTAIQGGAVRPDVGSHLRGINRCCKQLMQPRGLWRAQVSLGDTDSKTIIAFCSPINKCSMLRGDMGDTACQNNWQMFVVMVYTSSKHTAHGDINHFDSQPQRGQISEASLKTKGRFIGAAWSVQVFSLQQHRNTNIQTRKINLQTGTTVIRAKSRQQRNINQTCKHSASYSVS